MKLWMSGEVEADAFDALRHARLAVQTAFNERFGTTDYGGGISEWAYIAMIGAGRITPSYPEVKRYHRRDGSLEFRLRIDHATFLVADPTGRTPAVRIAMPVTGLHSGPSRTRVRSRTPPD